MENKMTIVYPQWQGGGEKSTYYGAKELEKFYLSNLDYEEVAVSTAEAELVSQNDIIGYRIIAEQMERARAVIAGHAPRKIFTVGGGCDADIPSVAYLNSLYEGNLTLLWVDAHGDLNTPSESSSKLFYGMPLRTLSGDGDAGMTSQVERYVLPAQIIHLGGRAFDRAEANYIRENRIKRFAPDELAQNTDAVLKYIEANGRDNIYVHLDLDVTDPSEFPYVPVSVPNGVALKTLRSILTGVNEKFHLVGMGVYEYAPAGKEVDFMQYIMRIGADF